MNKLFVIIVLMLVALSIFSFGMMVLTAQGVESEPGAEPKDDTPEEPVQPPIEPEPLVEQPPLGWQEGIAIQIQTNKNAYKSKEQMEITITITSQHYVPSCEIRVEGIENKYKHKKLNKVEFMDIDKGVNTVSFEYNIPSCYGCSGIDPGQHSITAKLIRDRETVKEAGISIGIEA